MAQMSKILSDVRSKYSTFSGSDIIILIGGVEVGNAMGLTISQSRVKAPVVVMGDPDPKAFGRGRRITSGTLSGVSMHMSTVYQILNGLASSPDDWVAKRTGDTSMEGAQAQAGFAYNPDMYKAKPGFDYKIPDTGIEYQSYAPVLLDEIPPVDIIAVGANEFGALGKIEIIGAEFLETNWATTVDDVAAAEQITFLARSYLPWRPINEQQSNPNPILNA
jgi:hypothetical protein